MSHWFKGILAALAGLIGVFLAAGARDFGIGAFGFALMTFACSSAGG